MKKNKWSIVKLLLENAKAEGMNRKKIVRKVANDLDMSCQNVYRYIKDNGFEI